MREAPIERLRALREEGVEILMALIAATLDNVAAVCARERNWARRLIAAVEDFGPATASLFEPLSPMEREETESVRNVQPLTDEHGMSLACHATRMHRFKRLLERLPVHPPKGKPGRKLGRPPLIHEAALQKARELLRSGEARSNTAAAEMAIKELGKGLHGSEEAAIAKVRKAI